MTSVPVKIVERRAEIARALAENRVDAAALESELLEYRDALAELDFCIDAIEDAAKTSNAEAVEAEDGSAATSGAPEAEIAPAGSVGALSGIEPKRPRAPKRDIRGMVLNYAQTMLNQRGGRPQDIAEWLGVPRHAVMSAIEHWQAKGRLSFDGGVVRFRAAAPGDADYVEPDPPLSSYADDSVEPQQSGAADE